MKAIFITLGSIEFPQLIIIFIILIFILLIPFFCYRIGKKNGLEQGKAIGFKEGIEFSKKQ